MVADALALVGAVAREVRSSFDDVKAYKLRTWAELVVEWRHAAQLTSIHSAGEVITELMVPALYALRAVTIEDNFHVIDYGCGSGCTGATLNIISGKAHWWLIDTDEKKLTFCRYAVRRCGIDNMKVMSPGQFRESGIAADVALIRAMPKRTNALSNAARTLRENGIIVRWIPEKDAEEAPGAIQCGRSRLWVASIRASDVSRETLAR